MFCIYKIGEHENWAVKIVTLCMPLTSAHPYLLGWEIFEDLIGVQRLNGGYPHLSTLSVTYAAIFIFYTQKSTRFGQLSAAVMPSVAIFFKSPSFFIFLFFYIGQFFQNIISEKSISAHIRFTLIFLALTIFALFNVSNNNSLIIFQNDFSMPSIWNFQFWYILVHLLPMTIMIWASSWKTIIKILPFAFSVVATISMFELMELKINGVLDNNFSQIIYLTPLFYIFSVILFFQNERFSKNIIIISLTPLILTALIIIANRAVSLGTIITDKTAWHEYVENNSVADCLSTVPVGKSLIVTNDLRYPADNFSRPGMQMQIPAIFGHQMYAGNMHWEKYYVDKQRFTEQRILLSGSYSKIVELAENFDWTHAIIFKRETFSKGDWNIICENNELFIASF